MDWTQAELAALRRAYARGTLRVSYDGKSVENGSAADLLARIHTIKAAIGGAGRRRRALPAPTGATGDGPRLARLGGLSGGAAQSGTAPAPASSCGPRTRPMPLPGR